MDRRALLTVALVGALALGCAAGPPGENRVDADPSPQALLEPARAIPARVLVPDAHAPPAPARAPSPYVAPDALPHLDPATPPARRVHAAILPAAAASPPRPAPRHAAPRPLPHQAPPPWLKSDPMPTWSTPIRSTM